MKFLLIKTLLLRRAKDEGFTLPIVIAIGLVMLLLSTINLIQSGEEQLITASKQSTSDALASAEFGIARYREFLNNNRVLAVYNLDQWTAAEIEACDDISDTGGGWADSTSTTWRNVTLSENDFSIDFNDDGDTSDNELIGQYKIVNYIYDNDGDITTDENRDINLVSDEINDDGTPPKGFLTVKGRSRDGGSEAQIQVEIPLGVNTADLDSLDPALWIEQKSITYMGNVDVTGSNIVLYRPAGDGNCDDPPDFTFNSVDQNTISDPRVLPSIVNIATIPNVRTLARDISSELEPDPDPNADSDLNNDTYYQYPRANFFRPTKKEIVLGTKFDDTNTVINTTAEGDDDNTALNTIDGVDRYYYQTTGDLEIDGGESILADGLGKVILYVGQDLVINTNTGNDIRFANFSNLASSRYLEIHVNRNVTITGDGNLEIKGLIHVPNGTVNISGSASVDVKGSIWAKNWDNQSSGDVTIDTDDYKFYSVTPNRTPKPLTYRPSNWETQEVQE